MHFCHTKSSGTFGTYETTDTLLFFPTSYSPFRISNVLCTGRLNEVRRAQYERNNHYDQYAIAALKHLSSFLTKFVVGHLPQEISRVTYFIILHSVRVSVKVLNAHYRKPPPIQGGLKILVEVVV